MDQANTNDKTGGPAALVREAVVMKRPFIEPRLEGATALLMVSAKLMMICYNERPGEN